MKKSFRAIQMSIVFMIVFASLFAVLNVSSKDANTASAQGFQLPAYINLERIKSDGENDSLLVDPENPGYATIKITYRLEALWDLIESFYRPPTTVTLSVQGADEDWIEVVLDKNELEMYPTKVNDDRSETVGVTIVVNEKAPYIQTRKITISATAEGKALWKADTKTIDITYQTDFVYFVSSDTDKNFYETSPQEPISIPINLINTATYDVKFDFRIGRDAPEGWAITPPNTRQVSASQRGENTQEVLLSVTPPYDFGYHDEIAPFTVDVYAKPFPSGPDYIKVDTLNFQVQSRGFSLSPSGAGIFVMIIPILLIVLIVFAIFYMKYNKK